MSAFNSKHFQTERRLTEVGWCTLHTVTQLKEGMATDTDVARGRKGKVARGSHLTLKPGINLRKIWSTEAVRLRLKTELL